MFLSPNISLKIKWKLGSCRNCVIYSNIIESLQIIPKNYFSYRAPNLKTR